MESEYNSVRRGTVLHGKNEAHMPFTGMVGFEIAWRLRLCMVWWRKTAGGVWVRILFICHGNICRSTWKFSYIWRFCDLKLLTTPLLHHRAENYYTIWAWYDTRTYHPTGCVCPRFVFAAPAVGNMENKQQSASAADVSLLKKLSFFLMLHITLLSKEDLYCHTV